MSRMATDTCFSDPTPLSSNSLRGALVVFEQPTDAGECLIAIALWKVSPANGKSSTVPCSNSTRPFLTVIALRALACATISRDASLGVKCVSTRANTPAGGLRDGHLSLADSVCHCTADGTWRRPVGVRVQKHV